MLSFSLWVAMDQASLASIHESKTLAGIFQHIVDDCRVRQRLRMNYQEGTAYLKTTGFYL